MKVCFFKLLTSIPVLILLTSVSMLVMLSSVSVLVIFIVFFGCFDVDLVHSDVGMYFQNSC